MILLEQLSTQQHPVALELWLRIQHTTVVTGLPTWFALMIIIIIATAWQI
jgi:hypothetical protein